MLRHALALSAAVTALAVPAAASAVTFEVGAATASTDPPAGVRLCLGGYGSCADGGGRTMEGIKDPLTARALAFTTDEQPADGLILVHTTNVGFFASYKTPGLGAYHLRRDVHERTGVPIESILVQADHSHAAPDTIGIWGGVPPEYTRLMQDRSADAAVRAWESRRPARVYAGTADGPGITSSYREEPNLSTDDEFRLLYADDVATGERIVTWSNYSPHATVLKSGNKLASGDWPEWASQIAEQRFGGIGVAGVGTLGREDFGAEGEQDAKDRLTRMIGEASAAASEVDPARGGVQTRTTFISEPLAQPVLLLNAIPEGSTEPVAGYDVSIDREVAPPWFSGGAIGTFAGAARIGDVFVGVAPGESFPQIQEYLRDQGGVSGARMHLHLGATNDFLGYMLRPLGAYGQVAREGATYLAGCPEEEVLERAGLTYDRACTDHWTLMVSPTIGSHVACTIQATALAIGFTARTTDPECAGLTATDGVGGPA